MKLFNIPIRLFLLIMPGVLLMACEENDPLSDTGGKTTDHVPFVTVSGIATLYPAGDTVNYNVYYWSRRDDIQKLALLQGRETTLTGSLSVNNGGSPVTITLDTVFVQEMEQLGDDLTHDPNDYETVRNSYNKSLTYIIPEEYQLCEILSATEEAFARINGVEYEAAVKTIILDALKEKGVDVSWEDLDGIVSVVNVKIETVLDFQIRVYDMNEAFNDSPLREVKVGAIEE